MYNGYKNYETWNAVLWLANDEPLYRLAVRIASANRSAPWRALRGYLAAVGNLRTGDGVLWNSRKISGREMNSFLREIS